MEYGKNKLKAKQIISDPILLMAFGFGSGLAKKAPGTCGTLAAIPLFLLLQLTGFYFYSFVTISVILFGIKLCGKAAEKLGEHDFGGIVWDEIAGYLVTMWFAPFTWKSVIAGFLLFRLFDIVKPWPIKKIDRSMQGGLGIMADDILAGIYAFAGLMALQFLGIL